MTLTLILGFGMIFVNLKTRVPWVKIPAKNLALIYKQIESTEERKVCDLGCGDGRFLFYVEEENRKKGISNKLVGYELSLYPYLKAVFLKLFKASNVTLKNRNFFKEDLSSTQIVFIFLVTGVMPRLATYLKSQLRPGTQVISYAFKLPNWPIQKTLETYPSQTYVYIVE